MTKKNDKPPLVLKNFWGHLAENLSSREDVEDVFEACRRYLRSPDDPKFRRTALTRPEDRARTRFAISTAKGTLVVGCLGHQGEVVWEWAGDLGEAFDERYSGGKGQPLGETKTCPPDLETWINYFNARKALQAKAGGGASHGTIHYRINDTNTYCGALVRPGNSKPHARGTTCPKCIEEHEHKKKAAERTPEEWASMQAANARRSQGGYAYSSRPVDRPMPNAIAAHAGMLREKIEMDEKKRLEERILRLEADLAEGSRVLERAMAEKTASDAALEEAKRAREAAEREAEEAKRARAAAERDAEALRQANRDSQSEADKASANAARLVSENSRLMARIDALCAELDRAKAEPAAAAGYDYDRMRLKAEVDYLRDVLRQKDDEIVGLRVAIQPRPQPGAHLAPPQWPYHGWQPQPVPHQPYYAEPFSGHPQPFHGYAPPAPPAQAPSAPASEANRQRTQAPSGHAANGRAARNGAEANSRAGIAAGAPPTPDHRAAPPAPAGARAAKPPPSRLDAKPGPAPDDGAGGDAHAGDDGREAMNGPQRKAYLMLLGRAGRWVAKDEIAEHIGCQPQTVAPTISAIRSKSGKEIESSKYAADAPSFSAYRLKN